mmetsp:Transcript_10952/g.40804  ORF Transcript_10952/g.40804 Transcript_10952/m.40804 type:complete len:214 (+) Transcript_10952:461-1102(+)
MVDSMEHRQRRRTSSTECRSFDSLGGLSTTILSHRSYQESRERSIKKGGPHERTSKTKKMVRALERHNQRESNSQQKDATIWICHHLHYWSVLHGSKSLFTVLRTRAPHCSTLCDPLHIWANLLYSQFILFGWTNNTNQTNGNTQTNYSINHLPDITIAHHCECHSHEEHNSMLHSYCDSNNCSGILCDHLYSVFRNIFVHDGSGSVEFNVIE